MNNISDDIERLYANNVLDLTLVEDYDTIVAYSESNVKKRLKAIEDLILPFFDNLLKDADKPTIRWPNRREILEKKRAELLQLTREDIDGPST